jgi:membrane-anchored mycosin MYCP
VIPGLLVAAALTVASTIEAPTIEAPTVAVASVAAAPLATAPVATARLATARLATARLAAAPECASPGEDATEVPWAQRALAPERVWPFTRGFGVTVAVLDSGVDAKNPRLRGRVGRGFDAVAGRRTADSDCLGTGTQVAGVIAAQPISSSAFAGIAPGVTILPIRVVSTQDASAETKILARGINKAVELGADVIAVSAVTYFDSDELRGAVANAQAKGVIVVAATGDSEGVSDPYPAKYEGVLGVGAITPTGRSWSKSPRGEYVDLVAPGAEVLTLQRGDGMTVVDGTGVACGFVAATAALVRARAGSSLGPTEVREVIVATTTPTPAGGRYGHGLVNPYAAINDHVAAGSRVPLPPLTAAAPDSASVWANSRRLAIAGTGLLLAIAGSVALAAALLPRARRRSWRSGLAPPARRQTEPEEPGPPLLLFEERPTGKS